MLCLLHICKLIMAQQADKKKGRNLEVITQLRAFETTYKAACRFHGTTPYKPLLALLQQSQDASLACSKVLLTGPSVDGPGVGAITECLASYQPVTAIASYGCNLGDQGLSAIAALLRASASKWWKGCKLSTLEVYADGRQMPTQPNASERGVAAPRQSTASAKPGATTVAGTPPVATADRSQPQPPAGVCPAVPQHLQLNFSNHMQLAQQTLSDKFGLVDHIHYRSQPPRPLLEVKKWSLQALHGWKQHQQYTPAPACEKHPWQQQREPPCNGQAAPARRPHVDSCQRFCAAALQDLSLALGVAGLSLVRLVLDHTLLGDSGISQLATGLGNCSGLQQLSLCYCSIGAAGIKDLGAALTLNNSGSDCAAMSRSSAAGAAPGASRLSNASYRPAMAARQSSSSAAPKLQHLLLSGNPLAGPGLQHLTPALRCMTDLQLLALADTNIGEADTTQLQGLVHALTVGPAQLAQLDLDGNYIGDHAAQIMLTLLPAKPSLLLLKLTGRLSNEVVLRLAGLMEQNVKAAKAGKAKTAKS